MQAVQVVFRDAVYDDIAVVESREDDRARNCVRRVAIEECANMAKCQNLIIACPNNVGGVVVEIALNGHPEYA